MRSAASPVLHQPLGAYTSQAEIAGRHQPVYAPTLTWITVRSKQIWRNAAIFERRNRHFETLLLCPTAFWSIWRQYNGLRRACAMIVGRRRIGLFVSLTGWK